jgi:hypothetical protein
MAIKIYAGHHVFGSAEPLPLKGFPEGSIRLRIRNNQFALARVRTDDGIREFYIKEEEGFWVRSIEKGRNLTPANQSDNQSDNQ